MAVGAYLQRAMRAGDAATCLRIGGAGNLLLAQETLDEPQEGRALLARAAGQAAAPELGERRAVSRTAGPPHDCSGLIEAYARALSRSDPAQAVRALVLRQSRPAHEALARP